jgi:hypothetical protein
MEPRYRGRDRAHGYLPLIEKAYISNAEAGVLLNGTDKRSLEAALTEPDDTCYAVGLEELRALSHQRTYAVLPLALPSSQPSTSP